MKDSWSLERIRAQVLQEEFRRKELTAAAGEGGGSAYGMKGFKGRGSKKGKAKEGSGGEQHLGGKRGNKGGKRCGGKCWYCHVEGHPWFKCCKLPGGWRPGQPSIEGSKGVHGAMGEGMGSEEGDGGAGGYGGMFYHVGEACPEDMVEAAARLAAGGVRRGRVNHVDNGGGGDDSDGAEGEAAEVEGVLQQEAAPVAERGAAGEEVQQPTPSPSLPPRRTTQGKRGAVRGGAKEGAAKERPKRAAHPRDFLNQSGGGNAATPPLPPPSLPAPPAASPRSAPPAAPGSREAGRARTTGASCTSQRASRAARHELGAHQEPRQGEEAVRKASLAPMDAAQGGCHTISDGKTAGLVLTEGLERAGEVTEEGGASRDEAAAAGGAGENDVAGTELVAAMIPRMAAATVPEVAATAASAAETVAGPVLAGGSAAAFGGGSTSPSATPRVAQSKVEEPSPGADQEQTAEAALSASPAPVTVAVLAAAMSAATREQGGAPMAEDRPEVSEAATNGDKAGSSEENGDPAAAVANEVKSPATLAEDDAIWQIAGTWTLDLLQ
ncbi:unnamed protein product [Closterium sp. NIES-64]|nr:unnamed protein product [Closterium sp. NIES-64]